jgi:hypothetical protein
MRSFVIATGTDCDGFEDTQVYEFETEDSAEAFSKDCNNGSDGLKYEVIKYESVDWEFIQDNYPNYYTCDYIAYANDLEVLYADEYEEGSAAERLLIEEFNGENDVHVLIALNRVNEELYSEALENYQLQKKQ